MGDSEDPMGINDKIEILSTDDDRIKAVGELLSSDSSRAILKLLFNEEMSANQIAQKTEISLPLVMYHLKKMQESGVVKIAQTGKNTKSHDMKFYTVDKFAIVILPAGMTEKAKTSKSLFNSFNRIYRFATIGAASLAALFSAQFIQQNSRVPVSNAPNYANEIIKAPQAIPALESAPKPPVEQAPQLAMKRAIAPQESPTQPEAATPTHTGTTTMESSESVKVAPPGPADNSAAQPPNADLGTGQQVPQVQHYAPPGPESVPAGSENSMHYLGAPFTGDPLHDLYVPIIIALSVGIIGLIIERILSSRKKKTRNYQI